ncbi:Zn-ribbon domain-containing OB-fold protein [Paraburkholderia sp. BCC1886]|uniref:Zn-ribbon domain-containing OB-fold protein n=1 Tax=Paraburkholderia sp. BCC1886 TaxID=2562670 RepID=UPI0011822AEC|nr:OB-fold domain-containing protein [Paraburkholderia sp. BCC1886]
MISTQTTVPNDPKSKPHWDAAIKGILLAQRCLDCGKYRFPATWQCAHCHGRDAEWATLSGQGRVESFCTFHKAYWPSIKGQLPYTVVQVMLDEGIRYMSSLSGHAYAKPEIGQRVKAWFDPVSAELTLVRFAPLVPEPS